MIHIGPLILSQYRTGQEDGDGRKLVRANPDMLRSLLQEMASDAGPLSSGIGRGIYNLWFRSSRPITRGGGINLSNSTNLKLVCVCVRV